MPGKKRQEIIIFGEGTEQELNQKMAAIKSGKEPLPDGRLYPDCKNDVWVKVLWDHLVKRDPFAPDDYFKGSKQLRDIILHPVDKNDMQSPLIPGVNQRDIEVAIEGGLDSVNLTFNEKRLLHSIEAAFADKSNETGLYPDEIKITRAQLYDYMGIGWKTRPDGSRYRAEAKGYTRKRTEKILLGLSDKPFPFVFKQRSGVDKKGEPTWTIALTREPIIRAAKIYEDVKQREIPGIIKQKTKAEKRFSHYRVKLNKNAIGEVERYFRYLPRYLGKEIAEYRLTQKGIASAAEINFIEYLFTESRERIEINYLKLAKKLKIKTSGKPERARKTLSRCYETALALGYITKVEENQPGIRDTKEVIHLNPKRFQYLKKRVNKDDK